jgi:hypothetical protein
MANLDKTAPVTIVACVYSRSDGCALKTVDREGADTREEFMQKIFEERATYQKLFNPNQQ